MDNEWERFEELLGSPENATTRQRAAELRAHGWQIETVLFRSGRWRFRRPLHAGVTAPTPPGAARDRSVAS